MNKYNLLPCPFCGSSEIEVMYDDGYMVGCTKCATYVAPFLGAEADDKQKHIDFWNARANINLMNDKKFFRGRNVLTGECVYDNIHITTNGKIVDINNKETELKIELGSPFCDKNNNQIFDNDRLIFYPLSEDQTKKIEVSVEHIKLGVWVGNCPGLLFHISTIAPQSEIIK
jgi:hypothetical protein